jgi:DNA-binding transcriptional MerR regulator
MDVTMTIGELAARANVATSAVRYYERRGLLVPDGRVSGQRRYAPSALRRLVFIGMLQDAGLSLDAIDGVLRAATVEEWKAIGIERLAELTHEIERLQHARRYLEGALLCRYDHPLTDCTVMGNEIDRRIAATTPMS